MRRHWYSSVLRKHVGANVILPEVGDPPFATFYLLHGLSDDYTAWARRTRLEDYVRELPLIVVMPDGFRGFYADNAEGPAYAQYVGEELVEFVERRFRARRDRPGGASGGCPWAGMARCGSRCRARSGTSRRTVIPARCSTARRRRCARAARSCPSSTGTSSATTPPAPATTCSPSRPGPKQDGTTPRLLIDCGTEDHLLGDSRAVHAELNRLGVAHEYREHPGAHDWDYWDRHVRDALTFHAGALGLFVADDPARALDTDALGTDGR
jgi:hypothetical protein